MSLGVGKEKIRKAKTCRVMTCLIKKCKAGKEGQVRKKVSYSSSDSIRFLISSHSSTSLLLIPLVNIIRLFTGKMLSI